MVSSVAVLPLTAPLFLSFVHVARCAVVASLSAPCVAAIIGSPPSTAASCNLTQLLSPAYIGACGAMSNAGGACGFNLTALGFVDAMVPGTTCPLCQLSPARQSDCASALSAIQAGASSPAGVYASCTSSDIAILALVQFPQGLANCYTAALAAAGGSTGGGNGGGGAKVPGYLNFALGGASALPQCGSCGINVCSPGFLCPANGTVSLCPAGYYCPSPSTPAVLCPSGSFCSQGATAPTPCSSLAACPTGAKRPVTWVPALIAALLFVGVVALRRYVNVNAPPASAGGVSVGSKASHGSGVATPGSAPPPLPPIEITFSDLRLVTRGNTRLAGVSGALRAGRMTAILGGSGAGKTTLTSVLLGKEDASGGEIRVAEVLPGGARRALPRSALRPMLGFVPQVDTLLDGLTVRESLRHAWATRSAAAAAVGVCGGGAAGDVDVGFVLDALLLRAKADAVVRDAAGSALSSGERKRVSIGTEVAAAPRVLFLDEPTTGLDSSSALESMGCVAGLARAGLTVACIIHQPRAEAIALFDDVILLGKGGRLVFAGPQGVITRYFSEYLGFRRPPLCSDTDYIMDAVEGACGWQARRAATVVVAGAGSDAASKGDVAGIATAELAAELASIWASGGALWANEQQQEQRSLASPNTPLMALPSSTPAMLSSSAIAPLELEKPIAALPTERFASSLLSRTSCCASFFDFPRQLQLYVYRASLQHLRSSSLLLDFFSVIGGGVVMGIVSCNDAIYTAAPPSLYSNACPKGAGALCRNPLEINFGGFLFFINIAVCVLSIPPAVRSLGSDREVFWREAGVGASSLAYFLGKCAADTPKVALMAFFFQAPLIVIAPLLAPPGTMYLTIFLTMLVVSAIGRILSAAVGSSIDTANIIAVNAAILLNLFCGWVPGLGTNGSWAFTHWSMRALTASELIDGQGISLALFNKYAQPEWRAPDIPRAQLVLLAFGVGLNAIAYILLAIRFRNKQR